MKLVIDSMMSLCLFAVIVVCYVYDEYHLQKHLVKCNETAFLINYKQVG